MGRNGTAESGLTRYRCSSCGTRTTGGPQSTHANQNLGYDPDETLTYTQKLRVAVRNGANRFVITSAANNSEVNYNAFKALKRLCRDRQAHLIILPIHYKNLSLYTASNEYKKTWAAAVMPYLMTEKLRIGNKLWVRGDISIQATAANPLSGMAPLAADTWAIFGHSQMALEPIPTPITELPGRLYTTGAITQKSYSATKVGAKADFHHVTGALLVETVNGKNYIRQLNVDHQGRIYDLCDCYTPDEIIRDNATLSLTTGDEHIKWMDPGVLEATYHNKDSIVAYCTPEYIVRHDVLDGYAGSHHHKDHYTTQYKKWFFGDGDYTAELEQVVDFINTTTPANTVNVLVRSNHHEHLDKWLERVDDREDHLNADLICELRNAQREAIRNKQEYDAFSLYVSPRLTVPAVFTNPNTPFLLNGVDFTHHGHRGANGARGSAANFANATHKATIGHTHSARIVKSVYQVGKSCVSLEYEEGLSSHTHTHCLQYANGKRTLIDIFGKQWRATNPPNTGDLQV
jgi:hypothetical protein